MKKFLLSAVAVLAAVSAKAQGTWYSVSADMSDDPATVVSPKGEETAVATDIQGAAFFITDGAENWECKNAYDPEKVFTATNGKDYPKSYIQGGTNGMGSLNSGEDGNLIPGDYKTAPGLIKDGSTSAHLKIVPTTKGTVYVAAKYGKNKAIWAAKIANEELEDVDFSDLTTYIYNYEGLYIKEDGTYGGTSAAESDTYAALPLEVEEGYTYLFWMAGSKLMLTAIDFVTGATPTPPAEEKVYSVIGTLVGNWDVDTDMELVNGVYSATIDIANAGSYEYKIRQDHDWAINWGDNGDGTGVQDGPNFKAELPANSSITITFDPATAKIDAYVAGGALPEPAEPLKIEGAEGAMEYAGTWAGNWWNLAEDMNADISAYDYIWIDYDGFEGDIQFGIFYSEWQKTESWGEVWYTDQIILTEAAGVFGFPIEKTKVIEKGVGGVDSEYKGDIYAQHARQVFTQDRGKASKINIKGIYIGSEADYNAAKEASAIQGVKAVKADGAIYNIAGQKVSASYKGLVIKNGKKFIQK